ncbi:hypothetical protein HYW46_03675 [Candidatus Daviesbacteria bacterium]|nr:hypothetical protein [Candidatus Daviesbacteria bacterium]
MKEEDFSSINKARILPPIGSELFLAKPERKGSLPPKIAQDNRLIEHATFRRDLYKLFDHIFESIQNQNLSIGQAVKKGLIGKSVVTRLWDGLSDFLKQDENNARILLYLPFETLPDLTAENCVETATGQRLVNLYQDAWIRLLHETEPRANFVDGDILEPGLEQPERVSKAGHLTPELLIRKIITITDILLLLEIIPDGDPLKSIAQGVMVSKDRGLISGTDWEKACEIIEKRIKDLSLLYQRGEVFKDPSSDKISLERASWLRKVQEEEEENKKAYLLSQQILGGQNLEALVKLEGLGTVVMALIKTGQYLAKKDSGQAKEFACRAEKIIQEAWESNEISLKDAVLGGLNQWARLGIVDNAFLQTLGIKLTDLSSPFQYDEGGLSYEFKSLVTAANKIKSHPFLSGVLYPGFLVFGSRLKGYADLNADLDAAMFFRPNADFKNRMQILRVLRREIPEIPSIDKFLEYWTTFEEGKLVFGSIKEDTRTFVGESAIHFFMGGVWIVGEPEIAELRDNMLERYLNLSRFGDAKIQIRQKFLGQIELDILQYRLMHKGYGKFYPRADKGYTQNSDLIDYQSDFWDPGYRRVATKLFLSRVFLPDLYPKYFNLQL